MISFAVVLSSQACMQEWGELNCCKVIAQYHPCLMVCIWSDHVIQNVSAGYQSLTDREEAHGTTPLVY